MQEKKDFKVVYSFECTHKDRSEEQYGSWSASYDFEVLSFCVDAPNDPEFDWPTESDIDASDENIPEEMYCVWVRYSDGDSFGRSTGNGRIVGLFKYEDLAHKLAQSIADDSYTPKGSGYKTWNGYFNRLESVEVNRIPRNDKGYKKSYKKSY